MPQYLNLFGIYSFCTSYIPNFYRQGPLIKQLSTC